MTIFRNLNHYQGSEAKKNPGQSRTYLITRKFSDTSINTNKIWGNLIIKNPLKKLICRSLISAIRKRKRQPVEPK